MNKLVLSLFLAIAFSMFVPVSANAQAFDVMDKEYQSKMQTRDWKAAQTLAVNMIAVARTNFGETSDNMAKAYSNLAFALMSQANYKDAVNYMVQSAKVNEKLYSPSSRMLMYDYDNIATMYMRADDHSKAAMYYEKSLDINLTKDANDPRLAESYYKIAALYDRTKDFTKAETFYDRALEMQLKNGKKEEDPEVMKIYKNLIKIYAETGREKKAWTLEEKFKLNEVKNAGAAGEDCDCPDKLVDEEALRELGYSKEDILRAAQDKKDAAAKEAAAKELEEDVEVEVKAEKSASVETPKSKPAVKEVKEEVMEASVEKVSPVPTPKAEKPKKVKVVKEVVKETSAAVASASADAVKHTVQYGETLFGIARKYNTTVGKLIAINKFDNSNLLVEGQEILISK